MILAIIGSRHMNLETHIHLFQEGLLQMIEMGKSMPIEVVSGGARGADTYGCKWAKDNNIPVTIYRPQWHKNGKYDAKAGLDRNVDIINKCTHVLAFPSKTGSGTQHSIRLARKQGKPVVELYID